ncbi:hypothetical protein ACE6H2_015875 [Prunus campanulata]
MFLQSMSAIDFYCSIDKVKGVDGKDRVALVFDGKYLPHSEQEFSDVAFRVLADNYVIDDSGTGVVHCAPAFGDDDYRV